MKFPILVCPYLYNNYNNNNNNNNNNKGKVKGCSMGIGLKNIFRNILWKRKK